MDNIRMSYHRSLERVDRVYPAASDAAAMALLDRRRRSSPQRKKSEVTNVPSLQAITKTAPNARHFGDTVKTLFR